jgi:1-acyl-sn-glycerol-3-phosphate acyltransferase
LCLNPNHTMHTQVKMKSYSPGIDTLVEAMTGFWLLYFVLSIMVIGAAFSFALTVPLYILGWLVPAASRAADRVTCRGIRFLMFMQPWFAGDIELAIPKGRTGCLLVSNHRSTLDAYILLSRVPGIRILAKRSLFFIPLLGMMMRFSGHIPAGRGDMPSYLQAVEIVKKRLLDGEIVHVFPELTRCPAGFKGVQPFSIAPFRAARDAGIPVIPIVFERTDETWPKGVRGIRFRRPVRVRSLDPIDSTAFASSEELMRETQLRILMAMAL